MPADKPKPVPKYEWLAVFAFVGERECCLYSKLVAAAALQEWVKHRDEEPEKVARAWAKRAGPKT